MYRLRPRSRSLQAVIHRPRPGGGQPAGGPGVLDEFLPVAVAGETAGRQDVADRDRGEKPGHRFVVDRSIPGHVQQGGGGGPADGRDQQIASQLRTVGQLDTLHRLRSPTGCHDVLAPAGIHHRHFRTGPLQIDGGGVPIGVGREHHRRAARLHRVHVHEPAYRAREHHTRFVVAFEHVGPLDQPRRDDQHLGPGLYQALYSDGVIALDDGGPVVLVASGDGGIREDFDSGGRYLGGEVGGQGPVIIVSPEEVATETVAMFDQQHPRPGLGCRYSGGHPGRASAGHHHIRMGVTLVVVAVGGVGIDPPSG